MARRKLVDRTPDLLLTVGQYNFDALQDFAAVTQPSGTGLTFRVSIFNKQLLTSAMSFDGRLRDLKALLPFGVNASTGFPSAQRSMTFSTHDRTCRWSLVLFVA